MKKNDRYTKPKTTKKRKPRNSEEIQRRMAKFDYDTSHREDGIWEIAYQLSKQTESAEAFHAQMKQWHEPAPPQPETKFDYMFLPVGEKNGGFAGFQVSLRRHGLQGWELCGFEYGCAVLKRRMPGTANEPDRSPNAPPEAKATTPDGRQKCAVEDCFGYGQFSRCGIWVCYAHVQKIQICGIYPDEPRTANASQGAEPSPAGGAKQRCEHGIDPLFCPCCYQASLRTANDRSQDAPLEAIYVIAFDGLTNPGNAKPSLRKIMDRIKPGTAKEPHRSHDAPPEAKA